MAIPLNTELYQTRGIRANKHRELSVSFYGERWYRILKLLETPAEKSQHFTEVAEYVSAALDIRRQLKEQGF